MCCFLKGRGKGGVWDSQCVNSRFSGRFHLNLNLHSDQTKNKGSGVKILLARSLPTTSLQKAWIHVPWKTHGKLGGSMCFCQKEQGLEALPFWLTHMHNPLHAEGNLSHRYIHSQIAILHVLSSNDKLMTCSEVKPVTCVRIHPSAHLKMLFLIVWRVFNRSTGPVQDITAATLISALAERFAGAHSEW